MALLREMMETPRSNECSAFDVNAVEGVGLEDHRAVSAILGDAMRGGPKLVAIPWRSDFGPTDTRSSGSSP